MFVHSVYYWLLPGASSMDRAKATNELVDMLGKISTVRQFWVGHSSQREQSAADGTFHLAVTIVFDDHGGYDLYRDHPLHTDFKRRHRGQWQKVKVYDFNSM